MTTPRRDARDLTVVIPTRRRWDILRRTLEALDAQSLPGAEVVVVVDGTDHEVPDGLAADQVLVQPQAGPGAARNRGVASSTRPLVLFLGDDMVPTPDLLAHHLARHDREPADTTAVLGHVDWHPEVQDNRILRWLDWSTFQFDYAAMAGQAGTDVGFGRFYSCNVSLHRTLFDRVGGFDEDFVFYYEDLDAGWRLGQAGMRLVYEPDARVQHLHDYDLAAVAGRFEGIALGERMMATKHAWFDPPYFHRRVRDAVTAPAEHDAWPVLADRWPHWLPGQDRARRHATRWYLQQVGPGFLAAWDRSAAVCELLEYLGDDFDARRLVHHAEEVDREAADVGDEPAFYRTSTAYLYDLTAFDMSGTKAPYHDALARHVPPGAHLLDYGCGIGADGLRLLDRGYAVTFADFDNPSTAYLRWRLARRGRDAAVLDVESDPLPTHVDAAYAFDVLEHVPDPHAVLDRLESVADLVVVNLVVDDHDHAHALHHDLPVDELLTRARDRGLVEHATHHDGRSHLLVYRGTA